MRANFLASLTTIERYTTLWLACAGDCERPVTAPPTHDREIALTSGAAMVVRREIWLVLGGMDAEYFMYSRISSCACAWPDTEWG